MIEVPLRVCIDARLQSGQGGVEQVVIGLAAGLSRLVDGHETYSFLTYSGEDDWLRPYVSGPCQILPINKPLRTEVRGRMLKAAPGMNTLLEMRKPKVRRSDGFIEEQGMQVMHFTTQHAFATLVPTIYQPHDLQHVHYPRFFSASERRRREATYRIHCEAASAVVMMAEWGKRDLAAHYAIPSDRIQVVPGAPILPIYHEKGFGETRNESVSVTKHDQPFLLYPARTWPHKNHLGLLDALAIIRDQKNVIIPVVCTGTPNAFFPVIASRLRELHLDESVSFCGFVSVAELVQLYGLCRGLVFPSYFEGWGMPVCEAMWAGVPIACSNATSLPDLVGDAALLFNPDDPQEMADAMFALWTDDALRSQLSERAGKRVKPLTWERSAMVLRALYRKVAGRSLNDDDLALLTQPSTA